MKVRWLSKQKYRCQRFGIHRWISGSPIERCVEPFDDIFTVENFCECGAAKQLYSKNKKTLKKYAE